MSYKPYLFKILLIIILAVMYIVYIPTWFTEWVNFDSFYSFGIFMLVFQGYFFWTNRENIKKMPKKLSPIGIPFLIIGMALYIIGIRADYVYMTNLSLPVFIAGIVLYLYGIKTLKFIMIPLILFTFSIPILPLHRITMPLQLFSAATTSEILKLFGINTYNEGSMLFVQNYKLSIVPGCSGLKSLSTLFFICLIYSYFLNISLIKKTFFVILSFPIAISMNILRLTFVGFYALYNGYNGLVEFHDNAGLASYVVSIIIIFAIANSIQDKSKDINYEK